MFLDLKKIKLELCAFSGYNKMSVAVYATLIL